MKLAEFAERPDTRVAPRRRRDGRERGATSPRPVARALLWLPTVENVVLRTLLSAATVYAVGCIVPAPLEPEKTASGNPPVVVVSATEPIGFDQGSFSPAAYDTRFAFDVTASDQDTDETLTGYLAYLNGATLEPIQSTTLVADPTDLTTRHGEFLIEAYCSAYNLGHNQLYQFLVYAVDEPLPNNDLTQLLPANDPMGRFKTHFDFKSWPVVCP